jgi:4-hydroxy-2-oxoheptanedioate aldolase
MNPLRAKWTADEATLGLWSSVSSPASVELLSRSGADYVCIDLQHGLADFADLASLLQAIGTGGAAPLVRVAANEAWQIGKALDQGALGVIVPLVETADEATRAVAACRYPPDGIRSFGPSRAAGVIGSLEPEVLGGEVVCFVMVETCRGLENVAAIAQVTGLDGIYIGPSDLAVSLGLSPRQRDAPEHRAAVETIRAACTTRGIVPGIHCAAGEAASKYVLEGFRFVTVTTDVLMLGRSAARELEAARATVSTA